MQRQARRGCIFRKLVIGALLRLPIWRTAGDAHRSDSF
jgi:hypothetical protein